MLATKTLPGVLTVHMDVITTPTPEPTPTPTPNPTPITLPKNWVSVDDTTGIEFGWDNPDGALKSVGQPVSSSSFSAYYPTANRYGYDGDNNVYLDYRVKQALNKAYYNDEVYVDDFCGQTDTHFVFATLSTKKIRVKSPYYNDYDSIRQLYLQMVDKKTLEVTEKRVVLESLFSNLSNYTFYPIIRMSEINYEENAADIKFAGIQRTETNGVVTHKLWFHSCSIYKYFVKGKGTFAATLVLGIDLESFKGTPLCFESQYDVSWGAQYGTPHFYPWYPIGIAEPSEGKPITPPESMWAWLLNNFAKYTSYPRSAVLNSGAFDAYYFDGDELITRTTRQYLGYNYTSESDRQWCSVRNMCYNAKTLAITKPDYYVDCRVIDFTKNHYPKPAGLVIFNDSLTYLGFPSMKGKGGYGDVTAFKSLHFNDVFRMEYNLAYRNKLVLEASNDAPKLVSLAYGFAAYRSPRSVYRGNDKRHLSGSISLRLYGHYFDNRLFYDVDDELPDELAYTTIPNASTAWYKEAGRNHIFIGRNKTHLYTILDNPNGKRPYKAKLRWKWNASKNQYDAIPLTEPSFEFEIGSGWLLTHHVQWCSQGSGKEPYAHSWMLSETNELVFVDNENERVGYLSIAPRLRDTDTLLLETARDSASRIVPQFADVLKYRKTTARNLILSVTCDDTRVVVFHCNPRYTNCGGETHDHVVCSVHKNPLV